MMRRLCLSLLLLACHWPAAACTSVDDLAWLLGEWRTSGEAKVNIETWRRVSDSTLEGSGARHYRDSGETRVFETLRIVSMSGAIFYLAKVEENPMPVPFRLEECGDDRAVFTNPDHDFPRRLEYRLTPAGGMDVTASDGAGRGFTLNFRRDSSGADSSGAGL